MTARLVGISQPVVNAPTVRFSHSRPASSDVHLRETSDLEMMMRWKKRAQRAEAVLGFMLEHWPHDGARTMEDVIAKMGARLPVDLREHGA